MSAENSQLMVLEMNPLDLLAEVAVSCSDDEKVEKNTRCEEFMEPEAELADSSPTPPISVIDSADTRLLSKPLLECAQLHLPSVLESVVTENDTEQMADDHGEVEMIGMEIPSKSETDSLSVKPSDEIFSMSAESNTPISTPEDTNNLGDILQSSEDTSIVADHEKTGSIDCATIDTSSEQCDSGVDLVEGAPVFMLSTEVKSSLLDILNPSQSAKTEEKFVAVEKKPVSLLDSRIRIVQCTANDKPIHFNPAATGYKCILNGGGVPKLAYSIIGNRMVDMSSTASAVQQETVVVDSKVASPRTPPKNQSVSQTVSQLLSPNFKLTMTNCIPSVQRPSSASSLVIGNIGSTTIKVPAMPISAFNMPVKPPRNYYVKPVPSITQILQTKNNKKVAMRYPNVSLKTIPKDHPLLDHDYCYHSYLDLVQAAKKLVNSATHNTKSQSTESTAKQSVSKSGYQPKSITVVMEDGTIKRKYRTKRIIAAELETTRRDELKRKAEAGDDEAQLELDNIKSQEEEEARKLTEKLDKKRRNKRRDSVTSAGTAVSSARQSIDSEEEAEAIKAIAGDVDEENPVIDHNPAFKDQFVYFGAKKYKSRRRHLSKKEDPYQKFWTTGELNAPSQPPAAKLNNVSNSMEQRQQCDENMEHDSNQEINDVLDVLGISSASTESPAASSADDTGVTSLTGRTDMELVDEGISSPRSDSTTAAVCDEKLKPVNKLSTSSLMDNTTADEMGPEGQSMTHSDDKQTADSVQSVTAASSGSDEAADVSDSSSQQQQTVIVEGTLGTTDDGLDDLLQGITVDEMSELITMALDDDQSLTQANGTSSEQTKSNTEKPNLHESGKSSHIPALSCLAKKVCADNDISLPANQDKVTTEQDDECMQLSQQSQTSNISLDFTEADLLSSDKNISLDLLNDLSATPPRSTQRHVTPHGTPSSYVPCTPNSKLTESPIAASPSPAAVLTKTWRDEDFNSPMVVPVTMYWNTFPALLIDGVKFVRLIDISRQALPSKETGILKRRAQVLGYEVTNCSDLQRNLLVRYAFAHPSRSNMIVSEEAARKIMASYMEKSEIEELSKAPPLPGQALAAGDSPAVTTVSSRAPAEPCTLMPQVLVEHKPLSRTNSGGTSKTSMNRRSSDGPVKERSSRLRQVKSSYRRFLSIGGASTSGTSATVMESKVVTAVESQTVIGDNASDRGYHSDQSPDSVIDKPITAAATSSASAAPVVKRGRGRKPKSARALLSTQLSQPKTIPAGIEKIKIKAVPQQKSSDSLDSGGLSHDRDFVILSASGPITSESIKDAGEPEQEMTATSSITVEETSADCDDNSDIVVHIRHIDLVERRDGTQTSQNGDVVMQYFKSLHSPCIVCCTCRQYLTLKAFTKHQHSSNNSEKLIPVKVRQRVEACDSSIDSADWQAFKKQKKIYETTRSPLKKLSETKLSKPITDSSDTVKSDNNNVSEPIVKLKNKGVPQHNPVSPRKFEVTQPIVNKITAPPAALGKRIPKQKKRDPDELYYTRSGIISHTSRKRKLEAELESDRKRRAPGTCGAGLRKHIG